MSTLNLQFTYKSVKDYYAALGRVVDQYCVKTDKKGGIVNNNNRLDDLQSIPRLIGKVINVNLETAEIVEGLPGLGRGKTNPWAYRQSRG